MQSDRRTAPGRRPAVRYVGRVLAALSLLAIGSTPGWAQTQPIRIGVTTTLTGTATLFGTQERDGAEMAVDEINAAGGVLGRPLKAFFEDNQCNPAEGVKTAQRLISQDHVSAMMGAMCSSVTLAIMPIAQRGHVPLVVEIATATEITKRSGVGGNDWVFKINPSDQDMAELIVRYLKQHGVKRVAVIGEDTDFGRNGTQEFVAALKEQGLEALDTEYFPSGTPDFTTLLTKLKALKPDAVAGYVLSGDNATFARQAEQFNLRLPLTGRFELTIARDSVSPAYLSSGGFDGSASSSPYSPSIDSPANKAFVEKFRARFHSAPLFQSLYAYEGVKLLADAIRRAGSDAPAAIQKALKSSDMPSMLGGTYKMDDHNHAHNKAVISAIQNGKVVTVGLFDTGTH